MRPVTIVALVVIVLFVLIAAWHYGGALLARP